MDDEPRTSYRRLDPANDGASTLAHVDEVVLTLARILGSQIARDEFERRHRADNAPSPEDQPPR